MATLKDLKLRIRSVKNTQKITKAMKMVAAAKLRRAKEQAEAARPYAEAMEQVLQSVTENLDGGGTLPRLLVGTGKQEKHLIVVATADRGLCGGFNSSIVREARSRIATLRAEGKAVYLFCVGKKGMEQLEFVYGDLIIGHMRELYRTRPDFAAADMVSQAVQEVIETHDIDVCHIVYNHFKSAISQVVTVQQIMPMEVSHDPLEDMLGRSSAVYEFEPREEDILADLVPRNFAIQIFRALLENAASEQGARMTAMDNATRNAGDMIKRLTLLYNRTRQAAITKELIEIISGAEAL
jgi:F-type H+-transporting ATPase subunit gamma